MNWKTFLTKKPVLQQARDTLDDDTFITFVRRLYRQPPFISKQAFAEIGWTEGQYYCRVASDQYVLGRVGTEANRQNAIHPRLVSQQAYRRTPKREIIVHHITLQAFFDQFITPTHGTPDSIVTTTPVTLDQAKQQPGGDNKQLSSITEGFLGYEERKELDRLLEESFVMDSLPVTPVTVTSELTQLQRLQREMIYGLKPIVIHDHAVITSPTPAQTPAQTLVSLLRSAATEGPPEGCKLVNECADKIEAAFE